MKLSLLLVCISLFASCAFSQSTLGQKRFTVAAIPYPFVLVDGPAEVKILNDSAVQLTAPAGTDLHNPASGVWQKSNAPKFLFSPKGDFEFSAKVAPGYENLYDGGALLIWTDAGNWAKVLLQNTGQSSVLGLSVVENSLTDDSYFPVANAREVFLKLIRKGKVYTFYTSADGKIWTVLRQFVYHRPEQMQIGFYAQSPKGPNCQVTFSEISFHPL